MIKKQITNYLKASIKKIYSLDIDFIHIEHPSNPSWGDYSTNICLSLSKQLGVSPFDVAQKLVYELQATVMYSQFNNKNIPMFQQIYAAPNGFINFKLSQKWLLGVLYQINVLKNNYGSLDIGRNKTVLVEFSQPNTNKPLHVGHSRNNFIGSSIANILRFMGYKVIASNYVGDIGIHICKSMVMYKRLFENQGPNKKSDHFVGDLYIAFEVESEKSKENAEMLLKQAQDLLVKWEQGDEETLNLWKKMNDWVYKGWEQTYKNENVVFDIYEYESESWSEGKQIALEALKQGYAFKDETGAIIADLQKYDLPNKVLIRSDGTTLYSTKDLQLAKNGYEKYAFDKRIYVVDFRQSDYFKQIFKMLALLGYEWSNKLFHVSYGVVKLPEGQMSSRKGLVVNSDAVFEKLIQLENAELVSQNRTLENKDEVVQNIALAAYRYGMLKVDPKADVVFDFDKVTKFEGDTGPYLLYTYARANSILEKAGFVFNDSEFVYLMETTENLELSEKELDVLKHIYKFSEVVQNAAENYSPNLICNFLFELCQKYNSFYASENIINSLPAIKNFRLNLTFSTMLILKNGLNLLGIKVVEKM